MSEQKYPSWIDEYARAIHNAFVSMVPASWGPIDYNVFFASLDRSFIKKVAEAVRKVKEKNSSMEEIVKSMPNVSSLRCVLLFLFMQYQFSSKEEKDKEVAREIFDFLIDVLKNMAKEDIFCYDRNIRHSKEEIKEILENVDFKDGNPEIARELGKLYSSLAALTYSLYRDYFPEEMNEIYGPYDVSEKFGDGAILLIKHFDKIRPVELWPGMEKLKYKDVKIFQVYRNVKFSCEFIGMHSVYEGNLIDNLIAYGVMIDGEFVSEKDKIKELSEYFAEVAIEQMKVYEKMSKEELVGKSLEWVCYQLVNFFKLAGMDWKPTQEMIDSVKGKEIGDHTIFEDFPSYEDYANSKEFEVYWLKDLYS